MAFSSDQDDVTWFGQGRRADGFSSVDDAEAFAFFNGIQSLFHVFQDAGRILTSRVVARQDDPSEP